jgi:3-methyladenine DNA glycosylase AlkD
MSNERQLKPFNNLFISEIISAYEHSANPQRAEEMAAYMKNKFIFYGINAPERRAIQNELFKKYKNEITVNFRDIARELYTFAQRELHQTALDMLIKLSKGKLVKNDIELIEFLITTHSWWDSVDSISKWLLGSYCRQFPEEKTTIINRFSSYENMWLNRSTLLFQLDYKAATDQWLLFELCEKFKSSKEFFIQKAIGWALREYSKVNPQSVIDYVRSTQLKPLSEREALRLMS